MRSALTTRGCVARCRARMQTYHVQNLKMLRLRDMDPSICLGYYCERRTDLDDMLSYLRRQQGQSHGSRPLFTVVDHTPQAAVVSTHSTRCSTSDALAGSELDDWLAVTPTSGGHSTRPAGEQRHGTDDGADGRDSGGDGDDDGDDGYVIC